jgi:hypothetical protein
MNRASVSIQRIREQLEALHTQEQDAVQFLTPGCNLYLHEQTVRLISRIRTDKNRLREALRKALAERKTACSVERPSVTSDSSYSFPEVVE